MHSLVPAGVGSCWWAQLVSGPGDFIIKLLFAWPALATNVPLDVKLLKYEITEYLARLLVIFHHSITKNSQFDVAGRESVSVP